MGRHAKDFLGQRFGKLEVVARNGHDRHARALWLCRCDCGGTASFTGVRLHTKKITHCGCEAVRPQKPGAASIPEALNKFLYRHRPHA